jgi:cobalt-zinc-cadmium efflux system outer membrane protein
MIQPTAPMTLEDLEQLALAWNPTLAQARMAVRSAQGAYVQAGLYPNPVLGYSGADMGISGTAGQQGGFLAQQIVTAGKLRLGRNVSGHAIEAARHAYEAQQWRVLNDVRAGYYEVLVAQKTIEVNKELVRIGDEGVDVTNKLRAAMEVSRADVLQARIEAETARLSLIQAQNLYRAAWQRLAAVLGRPEMAPVTLAGDPSVDIPELQFDEVLARILANSPELSQARANLERARCELARQHALSLPNFEIGSGVKYDYSDYNTLVDLEIALPIPFFNRNQGNIVSAEANVIAADRELTRVDLNLRNRLAGAFQQYANARRQVEAYTDSILPDAQDSLNLIGAGYRAGEFSYLRLLAAQVTYFNVNLAYLSSLNQLWTQTVELEGLLLRGGLQQIQ